MQDLPIVYCMMTRNRLHEVKQCLERVVPYVDETVIVDGGSSDDSIFYLRNREDIHFYLHPWEDNFSKQRNNYLIRAREIMGQKPHFVFVSDPDELFEVETMVSLRDFANHVLKSGGNMGMFQCRSVTLKGERRVWENLDDYWKGLLFLNMEGTFYSGSPHETTNIPGGLRPVKSALIYEHIKQEGVIYHRGLRNLYCGGGGPNLNDSNKLWVELKQIVRDVYGRLLSWNEFDNVLMQGNVDQRIKDWLIKVRLEKDYDGASEHRECYKTYFRIYHPEEEPEELRGTHIE